jgi:hypothetical protein
MSTTAASRIVPRDLTDEEIEFFRENNFVKLEQLLSEEDAGKLLEILVAKMGDDAETVFQPGDIDVIKMRAKGGTPGKGPSFNRWGPIAVDCATGEVAEPLFHEFSQSKEMGILGRQLLGHPVRYWVDESLVKVRDSKATRWHQDSGSTDTSVFAPEHSQLMVWIALDHIPPERASMRFVPPKTQTPEFLEVIADKSVEESYPELEELGVITPPFDLRPGDATVHGSRVFHSAPPNTTETPRWAYLVSLFRADATWTGYQHWPLAGVEGIEVGGSFDHPRFPQLG